MSEDILGGMTAGQQGVTHEQLRDAVLQSGYPLQGMVVDQLLEAIGKENLDGHRSGVQEEWSFVDKETSTVRQIDALVDWQVTPNANGRDDFSDASSWIRVHLNFVVECKQSNLPYVVFARDTAGHCRIPLMFGLPHENIELREQSAVDSPIVMQAADALGTWKLGLPKPPFAVSIAKVHRKGKNLELSGEETYRSIALPMAKALEYLRVTSTPGPNRMYYDVRIVFPIAVLRAPLVSAQVKNGEVELRDIPWVRLLRSEPDSGDWRGPSVSGFDVVQYDYLPTYAAAAKNAAIEAASRIEDFATQLLMGIAVTDASYNETGNSHLYKALRPHVDANGLQKILRDRFRAAHK